MDTMKIKCAHSRCNTNALTCKTKEKYKYTGKVLCNKHKDESEQRHFEEFKGKCVGWREDNISQHLKATKTTIMNEKEFKKLWECVP
jgi:hypothetical protein